jgi:DNA-binding transcriptional regulator GbsR (MarR family)
MRQIMDAAIFTKNVKAEVKAIYREINKELAAFQQVYDRETDYSRNIEQQLSWNKKIKDSLAK